MTVPLCFLGDTPMAAEVTNTPNPGQSNNPCRICHLNCPQGEDKCTMNYIKDFFGQPQMPPPRSWQETMKNTYDLWQTSKIDTKKEFERKSQIYGLKDSIMNKLIDTKKGKDVAERERIIKMEKDTPDRVYNPFIHLMAFDGGQDAPIEILHVFLLGIVKYLWKDFMSHLKENQLRELVARWAAFNSEGLHIPPIQPRYMVVHYASLIGKEYRLVLQAAPFVLFPLMTNEQKEV